MRIMVFDVPAESGGAMSILIDFYNDIVKKNNDEIEWIFVLSTPELKSVKNIKVINYPWVKKTWFHRLFFDYLVSPFLVNKYKINRIFSLQNTIIPLTQVDQIMYLHQSLPFSNYRYSLTENKTFWIYQNVISKLISKSIVKAKKVIVQTKWMKDAIKGENNIHEKKIIVIPPKVDLDNNNLFIAEDSSFRRFFYPASSISYKNHDVILKAVAELVKKDIFNFEVLLTIDKNDNDYTRDLYSRVDSEELPIKFIGHINRNEVFNLYTKSILLFPSYIESFGMPLLECKNINGVIIASNMLFSKEILKNYKNSYFFDPFDFHELSKHMMDMVFSGKQMYKLDTNKIEKEASNNLIDIVTYIC